jgi:hypothetical protein
MLIALEQPSYVYHAHDIDPKFYNMWKTVNGRRGTTTSEVTSSIFTANVAAMALGSGPLKNAILNCHGSPGPLRLGGGREMATLKDDLTPFGTLSGIGAVWIVSCDVARDSVGKSFCSKLASLTGSVVVASEQSQVITAWQGFQLFVSRSGRIDAFEGKMIAFYPNGSTRIDSNPRNLVDTLEAPIKPESEYPEEAWLRGGW